MEKVIWYLPQTANVNGTMYPIRSDFRAVLDILTALSAKDLDEREKSRAVLEIFYPDFDDMPPTDYREALNQCFRFIDRGQTPAGKGKESVLVDWAQDFQLIIAPINRIAGKEVRELEHVHWWTFLSWYMEIGDCLFAQIVRIRDKRARNKPLDKQDREFYRKNRDLIDLKTDYTDAEKNVLAAWGVKKNNCPNGMETGVKTWQNQTDAC